MYLLCVSTCENFPSLYDTCPVPVCCLRRPRSLSGPYGDDLRQLGLKIEFQRADRVRVRIFDRTKTRWEGFVYRSLLLNQPNFLNLWQPHSSWRGC